AAAVVSTPVHSLEELRARSKRQEAVASASQPGTLPSAADSKQSGEQQSTSTTESGVTPTTRSVPTFFEMALIGSLESDDRETWTDAVIAQLKKQGFGVQRSPDGARVKVALQYYHSVYEEDGNRRYRSPSCRITVWDLNHNCMLAKLRLTGPNLKNMVS